MSKAKHSAGVTSPSSSRAKAEFLADAARPDWRNGLSAADAVECAIQRIKPVQDLSKYREAAETILRAGL